MDVFLQSPDDFLGAIGRMKRSQNQGAPQLRALLEREETRS
jgi:hypothetical protein